MKNSTLLILIVLTINLQAQMERFPLLEPISNTIPESFIIEGAANELIMFWIDSTDLHMTQSIDEGTTWNSQATLVDNENIIDSLSDLNVLKLNSGRILVTYKQKFHYSIYSDNGGSTWSDPIKLVTDIGTIRPRRVKESSLSQTDDNKIWFVYNRLTKIFSLQSDDGITWSEKDTMVTVSNAFPHFSSVNSHWNGSLILIYQKNKNDTSNIYESISIDSGKTWSEPRVVFYNGLNKGRPRVTKDSNKTLWLTFTQADLTPFEEYFQTNIYYSKLMDGANSWSTPNKFTEYVGFDGWQNLSLFNNKPYITFTSSRENVYSLWSGIAEETNDNTTPPAIYSTNIIFQNDYPNVTLNISAKVYGSDEIDSVMFNYSESGGEIRNMQLFDDGLHNDKEEGDLIFGNNLLGLKFGVKLDVFYSAVDIGGNKTNTETISIESPLVADGGDTFVFDNNNIWFPIDSEGVLADVKIVDRNGKAKRYVHFEEGEIIYSAGFELTGYTNGVLWGNGVASASRMDDYIHGPIDSIESFNQIHVVRSSQLDFSQSWINWKDAVNEGADFYDGDGDGIYNPVDLNGNGIWDANEDKPDLLGDVTAFTVFNDGTEPADREFRNGEPQGIEIKQSVFSYDKMSSPKLANAIFVRYKIENMGTVANKLDSVYFGAWADMDIGYYIDDLAGTDSTLNTFYTYNNGWDDDYGINPPAVFVSFIQAPPVYIAGETFFDENGNGIFDPKIDTPLNSAINRKGELLGLVEYPGAKNNRLTSSNHNIHSEPTQGVPNNEQELRNNMLGYNIIGNLIDPCDWIYGEVLNDDCTTINPRLMYSGNPVTRNGWLNRLSDDQRQLGSIGPFDLVKGKPIEIIVAYIVGRGTDAINSITEARRITNDVIGFYNTNFSYVPVGVKGNPKSELPTEYSLSQNYPNPFNPSTTIKYSIPRSTEYYSVQQVTLKVYDILGREVATLINKQQKPGNYEVQFSSNGGLTSGVYFYRLHISSSNGESFNQSKKMLLIK